MTLQPDPNQAFDQLAEGARVKGASRVIPDAIGAAAVTREQALAVVANLCAYQKRTGLKWKEIARSAGISSSTMSELVKLRFNGNTGTHAINLDRWLELELKREHNPRPTEFVMTWVAEQVFTVAEAVSSLKGIGLVYGWAGIGKTIALQAVAAEKPGSAFISVKTAAATSMGVLQALAAALGIRDSYNDNMRALVARLEQLLRGTPRLLIVDEIHKLCGSNDDRALHVLRDLHDATGAPMLWSGTIDLVAYLEQREQDRGREPLAQIRSRITIARDLVDARTAGGDGSDGGGRLYTVEEVRRVFARNKMRLAPDAAQYLSKLASLPHSGGLRTCRNLVVIATKINGERADVLTLDMLRSAQQLLVSRRDFQTLQGALCVPARPAARVG